MGRLFTALSVVLVGCGAIAETGRRSADVADPDAGGTAPAGPAGSACGATAHTPEIIASGQHGPAYVTVDSEDVYWAESQVPGHELWRRSKSGAPPVLVGDGYGAYGIAADEDNVYWIDTEGVVRRAGKDGADQRTLYSEGKFGGPIFVDTGTLFWLDPGTVNDFTDGRILRMGVDGSGLTVLANGQHDAQEGSLVLTATDVYWTHLSGVEKASKKGGGLEHIFTGENVNGLAADGQYLYWGAAPLAAKYPTAIWRAPIAGGEATVIVSGGNFFFRLAVSGDCIYYGDEGGVGRAPKTGGLPSLLDTSNDFGIEIAVDDEYLYWTRYRTGDVLRLRY